MSIQTLCVSVSGWRRCPTSKAGSKELWMQYSLLDNKNIDWNVEERLEKMELALMSIYAP